jgi:hypothetical protein
VSADWPGRASPKGPCTFNINLTSRSGVRLSKDNLEAFEKELNSIFEAAGFSATVNKSDKASNAAFNFDLTIYSNFPASYPANARRDTNAIGYTPTTRRFPDSDYPDVVFPVEKGGVSVNHISSSYGKASVAPASLAVIAARVGAHEFILHYLLAEPGHDNFQEGLTREGFDYRDEENVFISDEVKAELEKICNTGKLRQ